MTFERHVLTRDEYFMLEALKEGMAASRRGEIPVGAVIVRDGKIIARAGNMRERAKSAVAHAETLAIEEACAVLGGWRLIGCELFVTRAADLIRRHHGGRRPVSSRSARALLLK